MDWLDKLREKPESIRFQIAIAVAAAVTVLIVFVWLSLPSTDSFLKGPEEEQAPEETSEGPLAGFREEFSRILSEGGARIKNITDVFGTFEYQAEPEE
jgi:hypothetical protein